VLVSALFPSTQWPDNAVKLAQYVPRGREARREAVNTGRLSRLTMLLAPLACFFLFWFPSPGIYPL
jgi:hypothetical protein